MRGMTILELITSVMSLVPKDWMRVYLTTVRKYPQWSDIDDMSCYRSSSVLRGEDLDEYLLNELEDKDGKKVTYVLLGTVTPFSETRHRYVLRKSGYELEN